MSTMPEPPTECDAAAGCPEGSGGRRRDKAATKRALLDAATEVFARCGYDAATTREVAAVAGVNEALIQRYFGGKAGLLRAIVEGFCGEGRRACELAPDSGQLRTEIEGFLRHELWHSWENRDFMRVLFSRAVIDPALALELRRLFEETRVPVLVERLRRFQAAGGIDAAVDLHMLATALTVFGFGLGFMQQVVFAEDPDRLREVIARAADTIARGVAPERV